ncbi:hypothetical protein fugu_014264 [Takifugu bimaculatus]|uniref:PH domain-containing protein n=1 Tax=Takifugu bimaculatus TaxID=433685 RepID=A0A4Z2C1W6_9TELE|nr:hypothetical protein fugu_014264 [Takifugu bimaculatus]
MRCSETLSYFTCGRRRNRVCVDSTSKPSNSWSRSISRARLSSFPDLEGILYLKQEDKKVWRPRYFLLRASGLYYVPKGKTKCSANLACFVRFDKLDVYNAKNYKQKYRAPTDFCFILKHPCIQKESNYIKFLCCDE